MNKKVLIFIFIISTVLPHTADAFTIKKVVIPAAGWGTRLFPASKAVPKELIPVGNRPTIQICVEEAIESGVDRFIIVINKFKKAIQDHFGTEKSALLKGIGKYHLIEETDNLLSKAYFSYVDQPSQRGLGDAILQAASEIGDEYFGIILPDDIITGDVPGLQELIEVAQKYNASVIGVEEVSFEDVRHYGTVAIKTWLAPNVYEINGLVEKPLPGTAPSHLAIIGRYILSPKIFTALRELSATHTNGELQLTDAIAHMMKTTNERILVVKIKGKRHDTGNTLGLMKAIFFNGLHNEKYKQELETYVRTLLSEDTFEEKLPSKKRA